MNNMQILSLCIKVKEYLKRNPEYFSEAEKEAFSEEVVRFFESGGSGEAISNQVYDFIATEFPQMGYSDRQQLFLSYINKKYSTLRFGSVLDVGAGRGCKLSVALARYGNTLYSLDPNIRLNEYQARSYGIKSIIKQPFICDEFARNGRGFDVKRYDHIFANQPCGATEHIIRQGNLYNIPYDILLCGTPHDALIGERFDSYLEWYEYLASLSENVSILKHGSDYYATNVESSEFERVF